MSDSIQIKITNWKEYNGRNDVQRPHWFRLENSLFENPKFYRFSHSEIVAWIYMMSQASKLGSDTINVIFEHANRAARIKKKDILSAIIKLKEFEAVTVDVTPTLRERHSTLHNTTLQDTTIIHAEPTVQRSSFDFEGLYKLYPRKEGKAKGLAKCKLEVKTDKDYVDLEIAIRKYATHCIKNKIEVQFIKHFSTFMANGSWRDWLDNDIGTSTTEVQKPRPASKEFNFDQPDPREAGRVLNLVNDLRNAKTKSQ